MPSTACVSMHEHTCNTMHARTKTLRHSTVHSIHPHTAANCMHTRWTAPSRISFDLIYISIIDLSILYLNKIYRGFYFSPTRNMGHDHPRSSTDIVPMGETSSICETYSNSFELLACYAVQHGETHRNLRSAAIHGMQGRTIPVHVRWMAALTHKIVVVHG